MTEELGYVQAGLQIIGTGLQYEQQRIGFELEQQLATLTAEQEAHRREFLGTQQEFRREEFGRREAETREQFAFAKGELGREGALLELQETGSRIRTALEQNQLRTASQEAGKKARLIASGLVFEGGRLGRSAAYRAGVSTSLSMIAPIEDQLAVSRRLGAISEEQFQVGRERLTAQGELLQNQFTRNIERITAEREFSEAQFTFETEQSEMRQEALEAQAAAAQQQQDANFVEGLVNIGSGAASGVVDAVGGLL